MTDRISVGMTSAELAKQRLQILKGEEVKASEALSKIDESTIAVPTEEFTGGSSSYYMVTVINPTTLADPYDAECNDIIEALGMNYAEGNAFKAIWRSCAARLGKRKKGYDNGLYDAEKVEFFGTRMVVQAKVKQSKES